MRNLVITIISVAIIVGIICLIGYNIGRKGYFDIKGLETPAEKTNTTKSQQLPTPKTSKTSTKKASAAKTSSTKTSSTNKVNGVSYLTKTGGSLQQNQNSNIKYYKATQKTIVKIGNSFKTYTQTTYFNSNQNFKQFQKVTIK
jgi:hypothetical protein